MKQIERLIRNCSRCFVEISNFSNLKVHKATGLKYMNRLNKLNKYLHLTPNCVLQKRYNYIGTYFKRLYILLQVGYVYGPNSTAGYYRYYTTVSDRYSDFRNRKAGINNMIKAQRWLNYFPDTNHVRVVLFGVRSTSVREKRLRVKDVPMIARRDSVRGHRGKFHRQ